MVLIANTDLIDIMGSLQTPRLPPMDKSTRSSRRSLELISIVDGIQTIRSVLNQLTSIIVWAFEGKISRTLPEARVLVIPFYFSLFS